jgi:choline-sulfatase
LRARRAYFALVTRLDAMIGQILDKLEATGLVRNTLVVYSSDHGDQLGERGLWWKHTFYEESVAVPLIMRWPGRLAAGERRKQIVNLTDVSATMLDALGAPALPNASGRSFLGVARNATASWDDQTFSEYCTDAVPAWTGGQAVRQRMIRRGRWKLVYYHGYAPQLFDLAADPDECRDCAADPTYAEIRAELTTRLMADWDPDEIERRMRRRRADKDLIGTWAQKTAPGDQYRWDMRADQNRLDASPP